MTDMARRTMNGWRRARLADLADVLVKRGFQAQVETSRTGTPALQVINPEVPMLAETVLCAHGPDGTLAMFWRWGMQISDADRIDMAAAVISRVLESRDG